MFEVKQNTTPLIPFRMLSSIDGIQGIGSLTGANVVGGIARNDGTSLAYAVSTLTIAEITTGAFVNTGTYWLTLPAYGSAILGPTILAIVPANSSARVFVGIINVVANIESDTYSRIGSPAGASIEADIAAIQTKLGSPAGASVSADIAAVKSELDTVNTTTSSTSTTVGTINTNVSAVNTKLGSPAGASVSTDIASVKTDTSSTATAVGTLQGDVTILKTIETGRWKIFSSGPNANKMILYALNGTTPLYTFDLKDSAGVATSSNPFERVPA